MADTPHVHRETETRARWGDFAWTAEYAAIPGAIDVVFGECDR